MKRILIAGFQHETNTFGATKAHFEDFLQADSWPGLLQGREIITGTKGINLPIAGFFEATQAETDVELLPIVWASAEPSSYVTDNAFEQISEMLLDGITEAGHLDGMYLDLHGAMVTESYEDGEGELLSRIRHLTGDDLPIVVSLDLHANLSNLMIANISAVCIFRTYPHIDMAKTGSRCYTMLRRLLTGETLYHAMRRASFLVPLSAQYTGASPCRELYSLLPDSNSPGQVHCEIAMGFPPSDIYDAGPAVVVYASSQEEANDYANQIMMEFEKSEAEFDSALHSPASAVAIAVSHDGNKPVIIADVQDNPGAGATSDTTGLLSALVKGKAKNAVFGLLNDPEVASEAHKIGIDGVFEVSLGGKSGLPEMGPYNAKCRVVSLSDGRFAFSGEMYAGAVAEIGPTALLEILDDASNVYVLVGSKRCQCLDLAILTHIGINPKQMKIIVVKSTVHFRGDFEQITDLIMHAQSPGANYCSLETISYKNLRPNVRRNLK